MSGINVRDLRSDLPWGAIIEGVDWETLKDPAVREEINRVFADRGLILFTGCEPTSRMHVELSQVFGKLKEHPSKTTTRIDEGIAPGVLDMRWRPKDDDSDLDTVLLNGKRLVKLSPWHFDHCYNNELNRAGVLRALGIAPEGGRTGFVDGIELYQQLSPELRERIEGLNVIYTLDVRLSAMRFGRPRGLVVGPEGKAVMDNVREGLKFPRAIHPAVWTRATGEKVLHVGPWMSAGLEHHEDSDGDALLEAVCQEINDKAHAYWHDWKPTDMVIWDNWRMLHAVEGCDPKYERRTQRTTIQGDYGLGYFEDGKKIGEVERELVA